MKNQTRLDEVRDAISRANLSYVATKLEEIKENCPKEFQNEIIQMLNRLRTVMKNERMGILDTIEKNKTINGILGTLTEIELREQKIHKVSDGLTNYFKGEIGQKRLIMALMEQELICNDLMIAKKFLSKIKLDFYDENAVIYEKGEFGGDYYFMVLVGSVDLIPNDQHSTKIAQGEGFGEFPILDPGLKLTVTAISKTLSIIASINGIAFNEIADDHPIIWKNMAKILMKRLLNKD